MFDTVLRDLRSALRRLSKTPGPTLVVLLALAVAIGATTIISSAIDTVWHAIPAATTDRLVFVSSTDPRPSQAQAGMSGNLAMTGTSVPDLVDWTMRAGTVDQFVAFRYDTATMTGRGVPARVSLVRTTANLFSVWGITAAKGRVFEDDDGRIGAEPTVLLSDRYWQDQFASDEAAIGSRMLLNGTAHTIVGILPRSVGRGIFVDTDLFVVHPLDAARTARDERRLFVMARLTRGATRTQAEADLSGIARRLAAEYPGTNAQTGVVVRPLVEQLGGGIRFLLVLLALIGVLVVAIACANVSNVVLAQALRRQRELSLRAALGARRIDHLRQIAVESVVISAAAGIAGVLLGGWGLVLLQWLSGPQARLFGEATLNWRVVGAGTALAFVLPLGFAVVPALQTWRPDPADLADGARIAGGGRAHRFRLALVAVQVALAAVLLVQIAMVTRTTWTFRTMETGFDPRNVLTFRLDLSPERYAGEAGITGFYRALLARLDALPGVVAVGAVDRLPVGDRESSVRVKADGGPPVEENALPLTSLTTVSPGYFDTLRIPVRRGRGFADADFSSDGLPVAVVSEDAARLLWPGRDPIGSQATVIAPGVSATPLLVVGIVANARPADVDQRAMPQVYVPSAWHPQRAMTIVVRTMADPHRSARAIREQAAALDANEPIFAMASMEQVLFDDQASMYTLAGLLGAIAVVALCLAAVGIYGVVSSVVTQRTREIGIRMAMGAHPRAILRMVMQQSVRPVGAGMLLGLPVALGLVSALADAFRFIDVRNPTTYIGVLLSIVLVGCVASYIPARRAARIDPLVALRQD